MDRATRASCSTKRRALVAAVALVGATFPVIVQPPALGRALRERSSSMPVLAGATTFVATSPTRWAVRLEQDVPADEISTRFGGNGRVAGFFFFQADEPRQEAAMIEGHAIGRCTRPGCAARRPRFAFTYRTNLTDYLPKGLYNLYVIADAAPVTVWIGLDGLEGSRVYRTGGAPVASVIETLRSDLTEAGGAHVFSTGDFVDPGPARTEFGLVGLWVESASHVATGYGSCYYYPKDANRPPREEAAFLPGCPTGDGFEHTSAAEQPMGTESFVHVYGNHGSPNGIGGWISTIGVPKDHGAVAAWIDLGPA